MSPNPSLADIVRSLARCRDNPLDRSISSLGITYMGELETIELLEEVMKTLIKPPLPEKPAFTKPSSLADLEDLFSSESEECEEDAVLALWEHTMQAKLDQETLEEIVAGQGSRTEHRTASTEFLAATQESTSSPETLTELPTLPHPSEVSDTYLSDLHPTDSPVPVVLSEAESLMTTAQLESITALREYYRTAEQDNRL